MALLAFQCIGFSDEIGACGEFIFQIDFTLSIGVMLSIGLPSSRTMVNSTFSIGSPVTLLVLEIRSVAFLSFSNFTIEGALLFTCTFLLTAVSKQ